MTFVDNGDGTATLAGTPAAGTGGTYALTFTADNGSPTTATQNFTLTVNQAPAITSAAAATFPVGAPGTFTVTTTGFPVPTIARGGAALPAGVTWVDNGDGTGTLSGTAGAGTGGTYALTFTASNGVGAPVVQTFTLTVNGAPAITSANATTFTVGSPGSFTVTTVGLANGGDRRQRGAACGRHVRGQRRRHRHAERHAGGRHGRHAHADLHGHQRHPAERLADLHADRQPGAGDHQRRGHRFTVGTPARSRSPRPGSPRQPSSVRVRLCPRA